MVAFQDLTMVDNVLKSDEKRWMWEANLAQASGEKGPPSCETRCAEKSMGELRSDYATKAESSGVPCGVDISIPLIFM